MKTFTVLVALLLLSCADCRHIAISDAERWRAAGYEVRINTYKVGFDGRIYGLFLWSYHAQAAVLYQGRWRFIDVLGNISDKSDFSISGDHIWWSLEQYKAVVIDKVPLEKVLQKGETK